MLTAERRYRLTNESGGLGLSCGRSGLTLAGVPLLRNESDGFVPRASAEIEILLSRAYQRRGDAASISDGLRIVAKALNEGAIARAMISALLLKLPELDWAGAARIADADHALAKYDPDELRDRHGRWTMNGPVDPQGLVIGSANHPGLRLVNDRQPSWVHGGLGVRPVPLTTDDGTSVLNFDGKPVNRPSGAPPNMIIQAGQALLGTDPGTIVLRAAELFRHGGDWDFQRVPQPDGSTRFVSAYTDYANMAIAMFTTAAGLPLGAMKDIANIYGYLFSDFKNQEMNETWVGTTERNIFNYNEGYFLTHSGQIRADSPT